MTFKNLMITVICIFSATLASAGTGVSGGGDVCEQKIHFIRDSLKTWIDRGGPQTLKLTDSLTVEKYSSLMKSQLELAKIRCVKAGDNGYPVQIDGTPKVCRFDRSNSESTITCDYASFAGKDAMNLNDQFMLVHHEYAGLAGLEKPKGESSSYWISNQITSPDRPLSAKIVFSGLREAPEYKREYTSVIVPFGPLKYVDGDRFIHHSFSISPNCEIETEIVSDLEEDGRRGVTVFSWLFMKNRGSKPDLVKEKQVCGSAAGNSVFTIHLKVPDKAFADLSLDSDILGGSYDLVAEGVNLSMDRFSISFFEE